MSRTERFKSAERGDLTTILPYLIGYTEGTATRLQGPAREATDTAKFERAASACRRQGGIAAAACGLLAEPRSEGEIPGRRQKPRPSTASAARVASVTELEEGSGPTWRPEGECYPRVAFKVINPHNALSGAGSDGLRFSYLQSTIRTQFGQEHFGAGIEAFWRSMVDEPDTFPPEFWEFFLQSNLTALGEKCRPVCVRMAWRRLIAARTMREWRPRMKEVNLEARQYGVGCRKGWSMQLFVPEYTMRQVTG